jgi:fatty-acyl-CoA synthase
MLVPGLLSQRASHHPDQAPLNIDGVAHLTYAEWDSRSNAIARGLIGRGVKRGDRVALLFGGMDWTDYAAAYFGILKAGGTATHLSDLLEPAEIDRRIGHASPAGLIYGAAMTPPRVPGWALPVAALADPDSSPVQVEIGPEDISDILYTSGTTGPPKPFLNPHGNLSYGRDLAAVAKSAFGTTAPLLSPLPVGTAYSAGTVGIFALTTAAPIIVSPPDDVEHMADLVERFGIGSLLLRPLQAIQMVRARIDRRHDLSSVTTIGVASGSLPPRHARMLLEMMPNAMMLSAYGGGSEAVPALVRTKYDPARPQYLGQAIPGTDLRIAGDDGEPVPDGELGEIWLRTKAPRRRYLDPKLNAAVYVDGWVRTGDTGRVEDGVDLYFFDRGNDVIRVGGKPVSSLEVENAIYEHPAIAEAAVVGIPDGNGGDQVAVALVPEPGQAVPPAALRAFLESRLAPEQMPAVVRVLDRLPRGRVSDKVLKAALRDSLAG